MQSNEKYYSRVIYYPKCLQCIIKNVHVPLIPEWLGRRVAGIPGSSAAFYHFLMDAAGDTQAVWPSKSVKELGLQETGLPARCQVETGVSALHVRLWWQLGLSHLTSYDIIWSSYTGILNNSYCKKRNSIRTSVNSHNFVNISERNTFLEYMIDELTSSSW